MKKIIKGHILSKQNEKNVFQPNGALIISEHGLIQSILSEESYNEESYKDYEITDYSGQIIMPGLIDTHIHFPQMDMIGAYSGELLQWLEEHTFPEEVSFLKEQTYRPSAASFIQTLLENGTTGAAIYGSSKKDPTECLLNELKKSNLWSVCGKISMNHGAPDELLSTVSEDLQDTEYLIKKFHSESGRLKYALTPRFALSCSFEQMAKLGELKKNTTSLFIQTHFSENKEEISATKSVFPGFKNYLDVYLQAGLLGESTILGHGIHIEPEEILCLQETGTQLSHCPTSNQFLGSGLMPVKEWKSKSIPISLATDVGAGTSFSMWQTMRSALDTSKLLGSPLTPMEAFDLATIEGAKALQVEDKTGSLSENKYADFSVYSPLEGAKYSSTLESLINNPDCQKTLNQFLSLVIHRYGRSDLKATYLAGKKAI